jgi:DNA-directed RNA polymerase subunit K
MPPKKDQKAPIKPTSLVTKKVPIINKTHNKLKKIHEESSVDSDTTDITDSESDSIDTEVPEEQVDEIDEDDKLDTNDDADDDDEESDNNEDDIGDDDASDDGKDDDCMYRFSKNKVILEDEDEDEFEEDNFFEEDQAITQDNLYVPNDKRITRNKLTKFERVRVLGERSRQLSLGAKPMISGVAHLDPKEVARMELEKKVMPLIIERTMPSGQKERWRVGELEIVN